ncbi:MAG: response regulator [Planctomycetes bacterium]|nr:response regulator [Planctomycetota bacterium]
MQSSSSNKPERSLIRTIRLDDARVGKILDGLDLGEGKPHPHRAAPRYRFRLKAVVVHMQQPGSSATLPYLVPTRDLSEGGLSFLHGGFVHVGTRCLVQLVTPHGTWHNVVGTVVRCRYVDSSIHEVALHFDQQIDPAMYCAEAAHCRVLLAEDDPSLSRLATFHLEQLNAKVDHAPNGKLAVEMARKRTYDVLLMDMEMPVMDGFAAVAELRKRGYRGVIAACTALNSPEDAERCIKAGCDYYLPKPFARADAEQLIKSLREEPLFSTYAHDPKMVDLIHTFVSELPVQVRALEEALLREDTKNLALLSGALKAQGSGFGFEVVSFAAGKLEEALNRGDTLAVLKTDVDRLVKLCKRARSTAHLR